MNSTAGTPAIGPHCPPYFTPSQWQELEQQALIFKYILAGSPVPQQLIIPIVRSFNAFAARIHPHSPLSYGSLYGKKVDPEPGRCRRTDGKKWRCSKDAYPDSKYCERHMHRGRNRSRKPVEIPQPLTQSHHSSAPLSANANGSPGSFQNFTVCSGLRSTGDFRYPYGTKSTMDEHRFLSEPTSSSRGPAVVDSSLDNTWDIMPSNERNYHQLHALPKPQHQQQQHLFFGREFDSSESMNNEEAPSLQPCFNEWPKTRDLWSDLEDDRSNRTSSSPTQLSISIPMAYSSNFSTTTSSHSPNDD